jgi:hypothetical protein
MVANRPSSARPLSPLAGALLAIGLLPGCATLQGILALRQVDFALDRVTELRLAGVSVERFQRYEELGATEIAGVVQALSAGELPLTFLLHVRADNPEGNPEARLLALDWTFYLQDRETVSGGLPQAVVIPAEGTANIPLAVRLDLLEFFEGSARDLVNLALTLAGGDAPPTHVRLQATPTVETPLGPIRYPEPVTILSREVAAPR